MHYRYKAADVAGKVREGDLEAPNESDVLSFLAREGLTPIMIRPVTVKKISLPFFSTILGAGRITVEDKIFLTKYLALMLKVGTDLFRAIDILIQDFEKPILKEFLFEVKTNIEKGNPFYTAFQSHPEFFSPVTVNLIKAAETSGNLEKTLDDLSVDFSKEADLKNRVRSALTYPTLLLVGASFVVLLMVIFVLPRIATVFTESQLKVPLYSRIVLGLGMFLNRNLEFLAPVVLASIGAALWYVLRTKRGHEIFLEMINRVPVIRELVRKIALARFAATLSSLLRAGIPMIESMEITAKAVGNDDFRAALERIAREGIARGISVGDAFRRERVFPNVVINLMSIGEKAGHLEEILGTLAAFYTNEIDTALKNLVAFIEPILLIGIGVIVTSIALSIIVPIYQLVSQY